MQKEKHKIKDSFLLIQSLNSKSLIVLNSVFNTHYTKNQIKKNVRAQRASKKFKFWDKLMREKPGFNKRGE